MNLWDSVQKGLEKATQEATRIAKTQRLRSTIDGLSRQIHNQQGNIVGKTMELFAAGQLTQPELLVICQEIANLRQQLEQAQNDLKLLQSQPAPSLQQGGQGSPAPQGTGVMGLPGSYPTSSDIAPTVYVPPPPPPPATPYSTSLEMAPTMYSTPDYTGYADAGTILPPPPPPEAGTAQMSALESLAGGSPAGGSFTPPPPPADAVTRCPRCQIQVQTGTVYCANCGTYLLEDGNAHLPTVRGGTLDAISAGQETVRGDVPDTPLAPFNSSSALPASPSGDMHTDPAIDQDETVRASRSDEPVQQDGGH